MMEDSEVWADLAENLEGAGRVEFGLCWTLCRLVHAGAIGHEQNQRMRDQLYRHRRALADVRMTDIFFWPPHALKPRVAACRKLAQITRKEWL